MAEMVYVTARRKAAELLRENWDGRLPVRLTEITQELQASKHESDLGPIFSGIVSKEPGKNPVIVVHSGHSPERRRFTWAHELGHVVERASVAKDNDYSFSDGRTSNYDLHEFFADEFAGALLMPEPELRRMQREGLSNAQIAVQFGVSMDALSKRIARLAKHPEVLSSVG